MRYEIDYERHDSGRVQVTANSMHEAVAKVRSEGLIPEGFNIECVAELNLDGEFDGDCAHEAYMGQCEACDNIILGSDNYHADEDGCRFCADCTSKAIESGEDNDP